METTMSAQIKITLPDGAAREYAAGTTGGDVAADISKSLGKAALA
jgi:threonyl-tRNA synthetase